MWFAVKSNCHHFLGHYNRLLQQPRCNLSPGKPSLGWESRQSASQTKQRSRTQAGGNGLVVWEVVILPAFVRHVTVNYFRLLEVLITVGCFVKIVVVGWMISSVELPAAVAGQSQNLWKCYLHHPYVARWQGGGMKSDFVVLSMTWPIWCWTAYDVEGLLIFFSNDTFLHPWHVITTHPQLRWVWFTTSAKALAV